MDREKNRFDVILVTAEMHEDHPLSPSGVIQRALSSEGFRVGVVERPRTDDDLTRLGRPSLFFGVTSGSIDSMLNNYTPLKRPRFRKDDDHGWMPDRAVIKYCNDLRRVFKGCRLVIGGIEASLRRFAHYDYWDNDVRRSLLLDSKADILVYGNGEHQALRIARAIREGSDLYGIEGTCVRSRERPDGAIELPSFEEVGSNPEAFCDMQAAFTNEADLSQRYGTGHVVQFRYPKYTAQDLDRIYSLPFTRRLRKGSDLEMARFSVVTHRGCFGRCHFCSIALHQGERIISRSEESIIEEIRGLTRHPDFKGYIDDLGGPSANMYGMDCETGCVGECSRCGRMDISHSRAIALLRRAREVPGVKKVFIRSGIRYDLALNSEEYIREVSKHHVSGTLKIAPEHISPEVLRLMNKPGARFDEFVDLFNRLNRRTGQALRYYFMIGHPGDDLVHVRTLSKKVALLGNVEQFQLFTPTPMSVSSCMYWTGMDPFTKEAVKVVHDYRTKKLMKRTMLEGIGRSHTKRDRPPRTEGVNKGGKKITTTSPINKRW